MSVRTYSGHAVTVNDEGFLLDSSQWTPSVAEEIARETGVSLNEKHWQVISFCREDAAREGQSPGLRRIAKLSGVGMKELYALFPKGPGKLAARIAGLPKPQGCI
ncbi:MAG TPA: TusE/DsrC/DsvC family sulfur relay protein [Thermoanaerobaculia bacterium]